MSYEKEIKLYNAGYVKYINHMGNDLTPLISARMSTQNPTGVDKKKDDNLRDFLWRHGHVSVFEQAMLQIEVMIPIAIARQFMRHKSIHVNEFSMRYSEPLHEYYIPEPEYVCFDDKHNKQQSGEQVPNDIVQMFIADAEGDAVLHKARYDKYRALGIAKERVRDFQPVSAYTKIMATANLRDWFFFLEKRLASGAQREIRDLAEAIYSILKDLFPLCAEVFDEHTRYAVKMSRTEIEIIRQWFKDFVYPGDEMNKLSGSRLREFKEKIGFEF